MLSLRLGIGAGLTLGLIAAVLADKAIGMPVVGSVLLAAFTLQALRELWLMAAGRAARGFVVLFLGAMFIIGLRVYFVKDHGLLGMRDAIPLVLVLGAVLVQQTFDYERRESAPRVHLAAVSAAALGLLYIVLPMGLLHALMLEAEGGNGTLYAVVLVLISKCGDIGGYFAGTFLGRHRMLPRVSPKKSWEGAIGGLLLTLAAAFGGAALVPGLFAGFGTLGLILFGIAMNVATQLGDFAESMLKRSCETKDSASLIPSFGGALDIIDSLVFSMPVAYVAVRIGLNHT